MKRGRVVFIVIFAMFVLAVILVANTTNEQEQAVHPETCVSRWLEDAITIEETFNCIECYTNNEQLGKQEQEP